MRKSKLTVKHSKTITNIVKRGTDHYKHCLTDKQYNVLTDWMTGKVTQQSIANKYGVSQSDIHKTIFGNKHYPSHKRYGGVLKKIDKMDSGNFIVGVKKFLRKK